MEQRIIEKAKEMASLLADNYDITIKKTKDNDIKILYYRPLNLANRKKGV